MTINASGPDHSPAFLNNLEGLEKQLGSRVLNGWPKITFSEAENNALIGRLEQLGVVVKSLRLDKAEYLAYVQAVGYKKRYPRYYPGNIIEKTLEHFIAFKLLALAAGERFIDIGAEKSPHSKVFGKLTGCIGYRQDLSFAKGLNRFWRKIGGDAADIPVEDEFFQAALAGCAIEHFENDSDIGFMKEMTRLLSTGGRVVVLPLYLHEKAFYVTDPCVSVPAGVVFEEGVDIHCVEGWGNRHGRFYSPDSLHRRLIEPNVPGMSFVVFYVENFKEIDPGVYCRFALMGTKVGDNLQ